MYPVLALDNIAVLILEIGLIEKACSPAHPGGCRCEPGGHRIEGSTRDDAITEGLLRHLTEGVHGIRSP